MTTDLEELRKLAEKATPGPWRIDVMSGETFIVGHPAWPCERFGIDGEWNVAQIDEYDDCEANAAYIAAANPATILALVSELEALREAVKRLPDIIDDNAVVEHDDFPTVNRAGLIAHFADFIHSAALTKNGN